jgi:hypothetical protein
MKCALEVCPREDARWSPVVQFRPPLLFRFKGKPLEMFMPELQMCEQHRCPEEEQKLARHFYDTAGKKLEYAIDPQRTTVRWIEQGSDEWLDVVALMRRSEN